MSVFIKKPLIIAGPCSAESKDQLFNIVTSLVNQNVDIIRAGIWKPRTRPGSFDGVGSRGLKWITELKKNIKQLFAIEVATPQHVDMALKAGVDVLWLGSRSTTNPFTVQGIADALKGVDLPVMVKNPINPDLNLWIGAFERLNQAGIKQLAAVHRGFSTNQTSKYRNQPIWQIPIDLKSEFPDIPIICDPSHIAGTRSLVFDIAQQAIDLDYNGLMVEVHNDPDNALSDADQQLAPDQFSYMMRNLKFRQSKNDNTYYIKEMAKIRREIDQLDHEIVAAVEARMLLVRQAGLQKKKFDVTAFQFERWKDIIQSRPGWITNDQINPSLILKLFKIIHSESLNMQLEIMKENRKEPK